MSRDDAQPRLAIWSKLRHVWRLYRAGPERPLERQQALEALSLFRLAASGIPEQHRLLWLIEEARASVALAALETRVAPLARRIRLRADLAYLELRLALLLRCIEQIELSGRQVSTLKPATEGSRIPRPNLQ